MLWELHDKPAVPTEDIYAALVPGGCTVEFLHVDVKYLGPRETLAHEDETTAGPSRAKESLEESGEDKTRQSGVIDLESRADTTRQSGVMDRDSGENTPKQLVVLARKADSKDGGGDLSARAD